MHLFDSGLVSLIVSLRTTTRIILLTTLTSTVFHISLTLVVFHQVVKAIWLWLYLSILLVRAISLTLAELHYLSRLFHFDCTLPTCQGHFTNFAYILLLVKAISLILTILHYLSRPFHQLWLHFTTCQCYSLILTIFHNLSMLFYHDCTLPTCQGYFTNFDYISLPAKAIH